jgi:hypothetical protein
MSRRFVLASTAAALVLGGTPLLSIANAAGTALPQGYPTAGCQTLTDPAGDAKFEGAAPNDPDLDITGLVLETTDTSLKAYIKVAGLTTDGPSDADGHRYYLDFTFNKHTFSAAGSDYAHGSGPLRDGLSQTSQAAHVTQLAVDGPPVIPDGSQIPPPTDKGFKDSGLKFTWDYTNKYVVIDLPIADIVKYGGAPFTGSLTAVDAKATADYWVIAETWDSTIKDNGPAPSTDKWTIGDNKCFGPPAGVLTNIGARTAQFTDKASFATRLTDAKGAALAGRQVTFALGRRHATVRSDAKGVARWSANPGLTAGSYSLATSYAGDAKVGAATLTTPVTITAEKTLLSLRATSSGPKRTVVATLTDDDHQAVAGQRVTWLVDGKSAGAGTTSKSGSLSLTTSPGHTVKAVFAAVTGRYAGSSAQKKV